MLSSYEPTKAQFLFDGFTFGFHVHSNLVVEDTLCGPHNLLSAQLNPAVVEEKLNKELSAGRIAGPFASPPFPSFHVSPLGVVPKKVPGDFRMIHHLSFPKGQSVNDNIPSEHTSVSYANIDDAIRFIKRCGVGSYLAKTDIKHAFRIIPIHPEDYHLLGMQWKGSFYYDKCMPMGCASSCRTFEAFSSAVEWIAREHLAIECILHILDDFLIVKPTYQLCKSSLKCFLDMCDFLGIPMAPEKTLGPFTIISFAGIELDTVASEARLPPDKIETCVREVSSFMLKKKVTLREL